MPITYCGCADVKRWTLVGDRGLCGKCYRRAVGPAQHCWGCNTSRAELRARGGGDRLREREGKPYCGRCRSAYKRGESVFGL